MSSMVTSLPSISRLAVDPTSSPGPGTTTALRNLQISSSTPRSSAPGHDEMDCEDHYLRPGFKNENMLPSIPNLPNLPSPAHSGLSSPSSGHSISPGHIQKPRITDFELLKTLGTGTFARVWLVRPVKRLRTPPNDFYPNKLYALKVLRKTDVIKLKQIEHVTNEKMILELCLRHPFIINIRETWSDYNSLYMLMDYSPGGEVFGYLRRNRRFDFPTTKFYAAEITLIMEFLHGQGVVYRDLKPENILLDARGHVKLVDFGFAKQIGNSETWTTCGTPEYLCPEVIQCKGHTTAVDWWALGILIYEFLCGFPPFYDSSPFAIYEKIVAGRIQFPMWMPNDARDIVLRLCSADLSARLGNLKGGAQDVKDHEFFKEINWEELAAQKTNGPIVPQLAFEGDTRYFDNYDPPGPEQDVYTQEMYNEYEEYFKDF